MIKCNKRIEEFVKTGLIDAEIEISMNSDPVKYELDKATHKLKVDRILSTPMHYPVNYGYVADTMSGDGDPIDVMIIMPYPLPPGVVIECRPIGMLSMEDEAGVDTKILAVPSDKITKQYSKILKPDDFPDETLNRIKHFFEHYKDLEENKWVNVKGWLGVKEATDEILSSIKSYYGY
jgi:inorganic pyrophosphatase